MGSIYAMRRADGDRFALDVTRRVRADRYTQPFVVRGFYDRTPDAAGHDR